LREQPYDDCLREHLAGPLGLATFSPSPYEAVLHRVAVGHLQPDPDSGQVPAPVWAMARSNAPAGSMLAMSARDLLAFARMHLDGGRAADGTQVLAPGSVPAMQEQQVRLPDLRIMGDGWGLGWELFDTPGAAVVGHDGNTIGQASFLRLVPGRDVAVALLTNGGNPYGLAHAVVGHALRELADVELRPMPVPPANPPAVDATRYEGTYSSRVADVTISRDDDGRVWAELRPKDLAAELGEQAQRSELVGLGEATLISVQGQQGLHIPYAFVGDDGAGHARYLHIGRAMRRTGA
jgi:CubicO group peptidase (beta-lactamase class C family)